MEGLRKNIAEVNGRVIVVEEHYPEGGICEAVCSAAPSLIKQLGHLCVRKVPGSAKPQEQLELHGVDSTGICDKVREMQQ